MQDEDFPPGISPYSSMKGTLQNQALGYASVDAGGAIVRGTISASTVGGRYWHFECRGSAYFKALFTNAVPQPLDFKANLYGVFVQGSYRFDAF